MTALHPTSQAATADQHGLLSFDILRAVAIILVVNSHH